MKKNKVILSISLAAALLFAAGCSANSTTSPSSSAESSKNTSTAESTTASSVDLNALELSQLTKDVAENEDLVEMVTNKGTIKIKLFPEYAPKAVENFMRHAKDGYYNGLTFHRVIDGFMIQGGDPNGDGTGGSSEKIKGEFKSNGVQNNISHVRGTISMARSSANNSASSQFFIMQKDTTSLDGKYAAFGTVTSGIDIVDKICKDCTDTNQNGVITDKSKQPVISTVRVVD